MKVLFIAPSFPVPAHSGGATATLRTLQSIHSLCEVHLLAPPPASNPAVNESLLHSLLPGVTVHTYQPRPEQATRFQMYTTAAKAVVLRQSYWPSIWMNVELRRAVESLAAQHSFDLVHCDWLQPAVSLRGLDLPLLIRTLDVHFVGMLAWADNLPSGSRIRKAFWRKQVRRFRRFETAMLAAADAVVTVSREDEAVLRGEGLTNVLTIPPPRQVELETTSVVSDQFCTALFTGRLDMPVNREGFFLFADKVWPHVRPEWRTRVKTIFAGGFPDQQLRGRASECGIEIHAPLSDSEAHRLFAEANIFLSPVASGTGIKIKALDAMAHSKPMIGFPGAFRGVPVQNGVHALIAHSPEEFAELFEGLVSDSPRQREIGRAARDFIRENFDPAKLGSRLVEVYSHTAKSYAQKHLRQNERAG